MNYRKEKQNKTKKIKLKKFSNKYYTTKNRVNVLAIKVDK